MRAVVLYDPTHDSTSRLARIVADELTHDYRVELVAAVRGLELRDAPDVIVVGSPTRKRSPALAVRQALRSYGRHGLDGVAAAVFDTRARRPRFLTGSAAIGIAKTLERLGAVIEIGAESFFVDGVDGPLEQGEDQRARRWARQVRLLVRPNPHGED